MAVLNMQITNNRSAEYLKQKSIELGNDRKNVELEPLKIKSYVKPNEKKKKQQKKRRVRINFFRTLKINQRLINNPG